MNLEPGRSYDTRVARFFLFLPLLARLHLDRLVAAAGYPSSDMIPAVSALLALLSLKLLHKERKIHIDDFSFDEAPGLFAGLNVLPKKSFATSYSYRTTREQQLALLQGWVRTLAPVMFPDAGTFSPDFHPIPLRGELWMLGRHESRNSLKQCEQQEEAESVPVTRQENRHQLGASSNERQRAERRDGGEVCARESDGYRPR